MSEPTHPQSSGSQPQTPGMVAVSQADLRFLIEQATIAATNQALATQAAATAAATPSTKGFKIADPNPFSGKPEDLKDFLNSCELIFAVKPNNYGTNDRKVVYALGLMSKGNALMWNQQYRRSHFANGVITDTWNLFKDRLRMLFQDVGQEQNALKALTTMKQGKIPIDEFNTRFLLNGHRAKLAFDNTTAVTVGNQTVQTPHANQQTLISMYTMALRPEIAEKIIIMGAPETINQWMAKAAEIDLAYRRTRNPYSSGIQGYGKKEYGLIDSGAMGYYINQTLV